MSTTEKPTENLTPTASALLPVLVGPTITLGIGTGIAWAVYAASRADVDARLASMQTSGFDLKWAYASVVTLGLTVRILNFLPTAWKNGGLNYGDVTNHRANPFIYQAMDTETNEPIEDGKKILYATTGPAGAYTRANRSLQHFTENSGPMLAALYMAAQVFPIATFVTTLIFGLGRIWHMAGYAIKGYGGHAMGFVVSMMATAVLEGMCLVAAILL